MGATLGRSAPMVGGVAQGIVQGRQLGTQEAQTRQGMALAAAEEGRQKEAHRLQIQQMGLAINGMIQQQEFDQKANPMRLENFGFDNRAAKGRDATDEYSQALGFPDFQGTTGEVENLADNQARKRAQDIAASRAGSDDDAFQRELIRGQMRFVQFDLGEKKRELSNAKKDANKLRSEDPEHPDLLDMDAEIQLIQGEVNALEREYREFMSSLGAGEKGSGRTPPVMGKPKLTPP